MEKCDLSYNRIYALVADKPNEDFDIALQQVLKQEIHIDIEGNPIGNYRWVAYFEMKWIKSKLTYQKIKKIK